MPTSYRSIAARVCSLLFLIFTAMTSPALAQMSNNVELLSNVPFSQQASDVWGYVDASGNEYAIIGLSNGTAFVNITDPGNPALVGTIAGPNSIWRDIRTYAGYAYVVEDGALSSSALQIIDLSGLPNSVSLAATYSATFNRAHNLDIDATTGHAYIAGSNTASGLNILSLANPTAPSQVGAYSNNYLHDVHIRNGRAYGSAISRGSLQIIEVSNISNPSFITEFFTVPDNSTHNAWTTEDAHYIATTDETGGGHLQIWDISDLNDIVKVSDYTANPNASIHNVIVKGDSAYIAYYTEGLRVVDISDPANPTEVAFYDTYSGGGVFNGAWGVYPFLPSGHILISDIQSGLFVFALISDRPSGTIAIAPASLDATLNTGETETQTLTISNTGVAESLLSFEIRVPQLWLSVTPTQGSLDGGESINLDVSFDATGLALGEYNASIIVTSNDAVNDRVEVPVTLQVNDDQQECVRDGDVNGDGALTPGDALCIFQIFLNNGIVPAECEVAGFDCELTAADFNCDGSITPGDALACFQRFLQGLPPEECAGLPNPSTH